MKDQSKTKQVLIQELASLRQRIAQMEKSESERKRAEEALRESEERYNAIFDRSLDCIYVVDFDGNFIDANPAALTLLGYERTDIRSLNIVSLLDEKDLSKGLQDFSEIIRVGFQKEVGEYRLRCKDGTCITLETQASVVYHDDKPHSVLGVARDITKRKRAEEALQESEEKYRTLVENASDIVFRTDENGNFTFVNPAVSHITGYTAEELIGKRYTIIMRPDIGDASIKFYGRQFVKRLQNTYAEYPIIAKDGHELWFGQNTQLIVKDGHVSGFQVVARDITAQKQAEEVLHEQEIKLSSIFRAAPIGIGMVVNRVFQESNDMLCQMTGYSREELLGRNARMLYPTQDEYDYVGQEKYRQIREKSTGTVETRWQRKDGRVIDIILSSTPLDPDDLVKGVTFTALDITGRKRAEETLKKSERKLSDIVEFLPDATFVIDLEGKVIAWNRAIEEMTGICKEEMIGQGDHAYTIPFYGERRRQLLDLIDESDKELESKYKSVQRKGNTLYAEAFAPALYGGKGAHFWATGAPLFDESGNRVGAIESIRDISEHKKTEEEKRVLEQRLHHADKMESIGTLAGGIAHDFNNLLMGIQGYASLILMDLDPSHPYHERLRRIEEQVQSGADLTRQLLGFARGGRYEVKPTDMNDIIKKTSSMFGRTKKEISMHRKYGKDLWPVEVDWGQMEQVSMNLYVNAWQAMPGGGEIYLETENVHLDDKQAFPYTVKPGKYVKITFTDTGTGMDEKTKERIFDPFFTTKEMGRGTGLGLATVYGIIKGHKGMINVDSEPGHGTTFTLYLPASEKEVVKEKTAAGTIVRGTESILLVDDEKMVLEVSKAMLESLGYRVYAAGSGQEAIAVYLEKRKEIDLVVLDMIMPGISGGETFDRLKEINPDIRVLLSSGYSINGEAQTIMDRGCSGFLQKPFQLEKLSRSVREMLG